MDSIYDVLIQWPFVWDYTFPQNDSIQMIEKMMMIDYELTFLTETSD
jgi:hypothetical protein